MDENWLNFMASSGFAARMAFTKRVRSNYLVATTEFINLATNGAGGSWYTSSLQHTAILPGRLSENGEAWGKLKLETSDVFPAKLTIENGADGRHHLLSFINKRLLRWKRNNEWESTSKGDWLKPVILAANCLTEADGQSDFHILELKDPLVMYYLGRLQGAIGHDIDMLKLVNTAEDNTSRPAMLSVFSNFQTRLEDLISSGL